jgi:hypothetical protein
MQLSVITSTYHTTPTDKSPQLSEHQILRFHVIPRLVITGPLLQLLIKRSDRCSFERLRKV